MILQLEESNNSLVNIYAKSTYVENKISIIGVSCISKDIITRNKSPPSNY